MHYRKSCSAHAGTRPAGEPCPGIQAFTCKWALPKELIVALPNTWQCCSVNWKCENLIQGCICAQIYAVRSSNQVWGWTGWNLGRISHCCGKVEPKPGVCDGPVLDGTRWEWRTLWNLALTLCCLVRRPSTQCLVVIKGHCSFTLQSTAILEGVTWVCETQGESKKMQSRCKMVLFVKGLFP